MECCRTYRIDVGEKQKKRGRPQQSELIIAKEKEEEKESRSGNNEREGMEGKERFFLMRWLKR